MKKNLVLFLFLCLNFGYSQSSKKQLKFSIDEELSFYLLDVEKGLSNNGINSIEQDSLGFIWIATPEGLNRYDGTQFTVYKKGDSLSDLKINDNFIKQINYNNSGKIKILTARGLVDYDSKKETFTPVNTERRYNDISCFYFEEPEETIIGVYNTGVKVNNNNSSTLYTHIPNEKSSLSSNEIFSLEKQDDSILWVGTQRNGLNKLNLKTKKNKRISFSKNQSLLTINTVHYGNDGSLWVGSNKGIHVITAKGDTLHLKKSTSEGKGLSDNNVLCFEEDNNGQIWVGTRNGGLNIINKQRFYNKKSSFYIKWYLPRDDGSSVFNRTVSALKLDWDNNMWIGTSTGLNYVNPKGEPIILLRKNVSRKQSISHDRIGALAESVNGKIWIGTDGAGLDYLDPDSGEYKHYKYESNNLSSLTNNYIISLYEDSKKRLWVGTYQGGLNKMEHRTGRFKHYLQGGVDQGSDVRVIFEDSKNNIWVGTNRGGLYKYNDKTDRLIFIDALGKMDIRDISEDANGYFWMATYGDGIVRYNVDSGEIVFYNSFNIEDFKTDVINSILALPNGHVLAGTLNEGLIRLDHGINKILTFTEKDGLSNNTVCSIVMENESSIWLGTYKGVSNYNDSTRKIYNLNTYTNVQQGKFNIGSGLITKSNDIYLGGDKGLNIFNPNRLQVKKETNPIVFKKLKVLDKTIFVSNDDENEILDRSILYEDHIQLDYSQTFFSIDYLTLKYPFVKNTIYSYKVDGYHEHWVSTNGSGKVNLANMPHGDYKLNVKAKFGSGDEVVKKLGITIKPPFWKTPLAYICYLIILVGALYGYMRYYTERIKLINSLEFEQKQRQLEYNFNEERVRFFTSFSHELKTPLTLVLAPLGDLITEIKTIKHNNSLVLIQKNAKLLLQSINKLLEFRKSNLGLSKLRIEEHNLTDCLEQWIHNYFPLAKKRDIALSFDFPDEKLLAWFDLEKMHIIFNNLLSNAFKYTEDKGEIDVSLSFDDENFEIKVKDTGYGIAKEELEFVFERYYQSNSVKSKNGIGIGLALSKNFTELHMGSIHIDSELDKGSVFSISIPRDKSLFTHAILDNSNSDEELETTNVSEWIASPELKFSEEINSNINISEDKELVLLIDDNPDILSYLDGLLEGKYDLIYANNGEEGVEKALRYVPDLIVSDVMMPKMNGIELCNALKETAETTHIPIILLTAKGNIESIQEGYNHGADDYIVKPFSSQVLQTRIRNLLDVRKQLRNYFLNKEEVKLDTIGKNPSLLEQEKAFLNQLQRIIIEHLAQEKVDVMMVAKSIGMSRTSLFRKIKAITGLNINQYIRKVKIDKAAELMKRGDYTVAQASYEVGFNNVKYFRKLFKEQFGKLPSDLIRKKNN